MEFIGTFLIVFLNGLLYVEKNKKTINEIELSIGVFIVFCIVSWIGKNTSGAQYNPVLSSVLILSKHNKLTNGIFFVIAQIFAAMFAISMLNLTLLNYTMKSFDPNMIGFPLPLISNTEIIMAEIIGSFLYVYGYYMLVLEKEAPKYVYGPGLGAIMAGVFLFFFEKSGVGLNSAKMLAYCLYSKQISTFFPFLIGNVIGSLLASIVGILFLSDKSMRRRQRRMEKSKKKVPKAEKNNK